MALHIPRPSVIQVEPENFLTGGLYESTRCETPTRFTLVGQTGVLHKSKPTTWKLSVTVCSLVLLVLLCMIVYMEVYMK